MRCQTNITVPDCTSFRLHKPPWPLQNDRSHTSATLPADEVLDDKARAAMDLDPQHLDEASPPKKDSPYHSGSDGNGYTLEPLISRMASYYDSQDMLENTRRCVGILFIVHHGPPSRLAIITCQSILITNGALSCLDITTPGGRTKHGSKYQRRIYLIPVIPLLRDGLGPLPRRQHLHQLPIRT